MFLLSHPLFLSCALLAALNCLSVARAREDLAGTTAAPAPQIRRVVISDSAAGTHRLGHATPLATPIVSDLPLLDRNSARAAIRPFLGRSLTRETLSELGEVLASYIRAHDFPAAGINFPDQAPEEIQSGLVRIVVTLGRYTAIRAEGFRFSTQQRLLSQLGLAPGDSVRLSVLDAALTLANTHPFRSVHATIGDEGEGQANLELHVDEQKPVRVFAAYDNSGIAYLGRDRHSAGLLAGNLWGREHQGAYQFILGARPKQYHAHHLEYRVPLPARHALVFDASYSRVRPEFSGSPFTAEGTNWSGTARNLLVHPWRGWIGELSVGANFKSIRNDVEFGGAPYLVEGRPFQDYNVFQFFAAETLLRRDAVGSWRVGGALYLSPGGMNRRNAKPAFARARAGAKSRYGYGTAFAQRLTTLPHDLLLSTSVSVQRSSANLVGSEQLWLGGSGTVRGYPERAYPADEAWFAHQELHGPVWSPDLRLAARSCPVRLRLLAFADAGQTYIKHRAATDDDGAFLLSLGVGLRASLGSALNLSFDYGWPQSRQGTTSSAPSHRAQLHVRLH